jgi:hypothetical protein
MKLGALYGVIFILFVAFTLSLLTFIDPSIF